MNELDDVAHIYVAGQHIHYCLQDPRPGFAPIMAPIREKVESFFWIIGEIIERENNWPGPEGYNNFKAVHGDLVAIVKEHWHFVEVKVCILSSM